MIATTENQVARADPVDYVEVPNEPAAAPPDYSLRDRRGLNRLTPELHETDRALERWARVANARIGTEWKPANILGRLLDKDYVPGCGQSVAPVFIDEDDLATDAAVAHLGEIDRRVIRAYYVDRHRARLGQWWRLLTDMNKRQADNVLNRARWQVHGYRTAKGVTQSRGIV
jgi:hypothetical protein